MDRPSPVQTHEGWAIFRLQRAGVPVDFLAYAGTDLDADPDRVAFRIAGGCSGASRSPSSIATLRPGTRAGS